MLCEHPDTFPFWTDPKAELGLIRIGLSEAFLESIEDDLVGLEWLVTSGHACKGDALIQLHTAHRPLTLRAPFAMELLAINDDAIHDPRLVRTSPYYEGWLAEIRRHE